MLKGKCLCGAVQYAVRDEFVYARNCHCSNCRRATGAAFKPFAGIEREKLNITEGEGSVLVFGEENANDVRCKKCGSFLYSVVREGAFVHVTMGTLLDNPNNRSAAKIVRRNRAVSPLLAEKFQKRSSPSGRTGLLHWYWIRKAICSAFIR